MVRRRESEGFIKAVVGDTAHVLLSRFLSSALTAPRHPRVTSATIGGVVVDDREEAENLALGRD